MKLLYTFVNEEGDEYGNTFIWAEAIAQLEEFPNDHIIVTVWVD